MKQPIIAQEKSFSIDKSSPTINQDIKHAQRVLLHNVKTYHAYLNSFVQTEKSKEAQCETANQILQNFEMQVAEILQISIETVTKRIKKYKKKTAQSKEEQRNHEQQIEKLHENRKTILVWAQKNWLQIYVKIRTLVPTFYYEKGCFATCEHILSPSLYRYFQKYWKQIEIRIHSSHKKSSKPDPQTTSESSTRKTTQDVPPSTQFPKPKHNNLLRKKIKQFIWHHASIVVMTGFIIFSLGIVLTLFFAVGNPFANSLYSDELNDHVNILQIFSI